MAEEGTGGRGKGERGGRRKGPEREGEGRKREGPHDTLAWGPQCLNPALTRLISVERNLKIKTHVVVAEHLRCVCYCVFDPKFYVMIY